jgi:hypothetical protein
MHSYIDTRIIVLQGLQGDAARPPGIGSRRTDGATWGRTRGGRNAS